MFLKCLRTSQNCRSENLLKEFEAYLKELTILGFNSASYDLNLIKPLLIQELLGKINFVIKRANAYLCIKTEKLRFLDIKNFLAPGFSYKKFLSAYGCHGEKFFFPYEFLTSLDKLDYDQVPDHQHFYSNLTKSNITEEENYRRSLCNKLGKKRMENTQRPAHLLQHHGLHPVYRSCG